MIRGPAARPRAAAYSTRNLARSKKMDPWHRGERRCWTSTSEHDPQRTMRAHRPPIQPSRRTVLTGLGAVMLLPSTTLPAAAQIQDRQSVRLAATKMALIPGQPETLAWRFDADSTQWRLR